MTIAVDWDVKTKTKQTRFYRTRYCSIWAANNKDADQSTLMHKLNCVLVIRTGIKQVKHVCGTNMLNIFMTYRY